MIRNRGSAVFLDPNCRGGPSRLDTRTILKGGPDVFLLELLCAFVGLLAIRRRPRPRAVPPTQIPRRPARTRSRVPTVATRGSGQEGQGRRARQGEDD